MSGGRWEPWRGAAAGIWRPAARGAAEVLGVQDGSPKPSEEPPGRDVRSRRGARARPAPLVSDHTVWSPARSPSCPGRHGSFVLPDDVSICLRLSAETGTSGASGCVSRSQRKRL